jgi:helix-turn-helix protein
VQESPFASERRLGFSIAHPELLAAALPPAAKVVYLVIDLHANRRTQTSWPGRDLIARESGLSVHCVTDSIQALENAGWLRVERRRGKGNRYVTLDGPPAGSSADLAPHQCRKRTTGSSESEPEQEPVEQEPRTNPSPPPPADPPPADLRPDVTRICDALADAVEANGSKRPTIDKRWRTEARLLLDKDRRTEEQVMAAIRWCQADLFWRANVRSMPTLRAKYDQLRLRAQMEAHLAARRRGTVAERNAAVFAKVRAEEAGKRTAGAGA